MRLARIVRGRAVLRTIDRPADALGAVDGVVAPTLVGTRGLDLVDLRVDAEPARLDVVELAALRARGAALVIGVSALPRSGGVLDALIPTADAVTTLTGAAARDIERRWGVRPTVVPHPNAVPLDLVDRPRPDRPRPRIGLDLGADPASAARRLPMLAVLAAEAPARGADLVVDLERPALADPRVAAALDALGDDSAVEVFVHDGLAAAERWRRWQRLDLAVLAHLPPAAHSQRLEACYDLGTRVLARRDGYGPDQQAGVLDYGVDRDGDPVAVDVVAALDRIAEPGGPGPWRADRAEREAQRRRAGLALVDVYHRALAEVRA